jgi:methanogenic corrinoid protein MtbC1
VKEYKVMIKSLNKMILQFDIQNVVSITSKAMDSGIPLPVLMERGLLEPLKKLQKMYELRVIGTPELFLGASIVEEAIRILRSNPKFQKNSLKGRVVIGTIGSPHEGGKTLVRTALTVAGFDVYDIGINKKPTDFVEAANKSNAHIVASSCAVLYALPLQQEIEILLKKRRIRDKVRTMIGGAATNPEWAKNRC